MTSLPQKLIALSFALLCGPLYAEIQSQEITYNAGDTQLKGYLAWDDSSNEKRPGVLVVHEWWGHNGYAQKRARMLAKSGYIAFALDMYGAGKNTQHPKEAQAMMSQVIKNMPLAEQRFKAAQKILTEHPLHQANKTAAIGYCFGGAMVLHMARQGMPLAGVASFHGSLGTQVGAQPGSIKSKVLVLHGADDPFVSDAQIQSFKQEMKTAQADFEFISYPNAKHSFTNPEADRLGQEFGLPLAYSQEADQQSWIKMQAFLSEIF
ncbi:MAG: dienelactone hydrolase [Gammaproteobacteria bacterium]|nr:MAG: dienelactone hydrolase [Gammaproteobacteria bacterium]